jgi:hypothetical protein
VKKTKQLKALQAAMDALQAMGEYVEVEGTPVRLGENYEMICTFGTAQDEEGRIMFAHSQPGNGWNVGFVSARSGLPMTCFTRGRNKDGRWLRIPYFRYR